MPRLAWPRQTAQKKKKRPVDLPIDIGMGPAAYLITGQVFQDRLVHTGIALSAEAILDNKTLRKFKNPIPSQYREQVLQMDERESATCSLAAGCTSRRRSARAARGRTGSALAPSASGSSYLPASTPV